MNEVIEAEVISREIIPAAPSTATLFGTSEPVEIVAKARDVANALKDVIRQQGLISNISGKEYVRVEGWTLLGTMLGVFPVNVWTKEVEGGWEARVEARTTSGAVVGAAEAQCTKSEKTWASRDSYALRSMAQTRATSKALRMPLGFVVTLAGFEATPAEEMTFEQQEPRKTRQPEGPIPTCKITAHGPCSFVPGGTSKPNAKFPNGRPYESFWACQFPDCKEGWQGRKWSIKASEWQDQQTQQTQLNSDPIPPADYDAVPFE